MERTRSLLSEEEVEEAGRYEAWWQEQLERRVGVAQTCVRERILERADRNTFLYDPEHRLLLCRNAKVGTSTWLQHFRRGLEKVAVAWTNIGDLLWDPQSVLAI